jgi:hypothetical protein
MLDQDDISNKLRALIGSSRKPGRRWLSWALGLAATALFVPAAHYADTMIFPVISNATQLVLNEGPPTETHLQFVYDKNRNCQYTGVYFFVNGTAIRQIDRLDNRPAMQRPLGRNRSGTFILNIPRDTFIEHGLIQLEHRCHFLWPHKKLIYGG